MLSKTHELLSDDESTSLSERLTLDDENDHISTKACEYLILFDQIRAKGVTIMDFIYNHVA